MTYVYTTDGLRFHTVGDYVREDGQYKFEEDGAVFEAQNVVCISDSSMNIEKV